MGFCESLPHLLPLFAAWPAAVLFQEAHLAPEALAGAKALVHRLLPMYAMFTGSGRRLTRSGARLQAVTLVHVQLAARASLLDVKEQAAAVEQAAPDVLAHAHFLRIIDPRSDVTLLIANCYQYQATDPILQEALLSLVTAVLVRWSSQTDHVILGGDWNASLSPRIGYAGAAPTVLADARLREWSETSALACAAPEDPTWTSCNDQRHSVLDCFFHKSKDVSQGGLSPAVAFPSPDPRHDHKGVRVTLRMEGIEAMPPPETLWRPLRLKMRGWARKRMEWQEVTGQALGASVEQDHGARADRFAQLEEMKKVAMDCARKVLGETGGKIRALIPHHTKEFRKLKARLTLLKVVLREVYARRTSGQLLRPPSRAMRQAWDAGLYPQPATFSILTSLWFPPHAEWTEGWLRMLRLQSQQVEEEMHFLRSSERNRDTERSRQAAVDRFYDGGELRRLLHPQTPTAHSPMLRTSVSDSFVVTGSDLSLQTVVVDLAHIRGLTLQCCPGHRGTTKGYSVRSTGSGPSIQDSHATAGGPTPGPLGH